MSNPIQNQELIPLDIIKYMCTSHEIDQSLLGIISLTSKTYLKHFHDACRLVDQLNRKVPSHIGYTHFDHTNLYKYLLQKSSGMIHTTTFLVTLARQRRVVSLCDEACLHPQVKATILQFNKPIFKVEKQGLNYNGTASITLEVVWEFIQADYDGNEKTYHPHTHSICQAKSLKVLAMSTFAADSSSPTGFKTVDMDDQQKSEIHSLLVFPIQFFNNQLKRLKVDFGNAGKDWSKDLFTQKNPQSICTYIGE